MSERTSPISPRSPQTSDELFAFEGVDALVGAWRDGLTPDPALTVSEWADPHHRDRDHGILRRVAPNRGLCRVRTGRPVSQITFLDRMVAWAAPEAGVRRALARRSFDALATKTRGYDGAAKGLRSSAQDDGLGVGKLGHRNLRFESAATIAALLRGQAPRLRGWRGGQVLSILVL